MYFLNTLCHLLEWLQLHVSRTLSRERKGIFTDNVAKESHYRAASGDGLRGGGVVSTMQGFNKRHLSGCLTSPNFPVAPQAAAAQKERGYIITNLRKLFFFKFRSSCKKLYLDKVNFSSFGFYIFHWICVKKKKIWQVCCASLSSPWAWLAVHTVSRWALPHQLQVRFNSCGYWNVWMTVCYHQ